MGVTPSPSSRDSARCDPVGPADARARWARVLCAAAAVLSALGARVIFLTGVSDEAENQAFLAQCGQPWLRKPYPIAALRSAIQQIVEGAGAAPTRPDLHALRGASSSRKCPAQRQRRQARSEAVQRWCARSGKVRMYDRPDPA